LHLPSVTGAVVVAIGRNEGGLMIPNHSEVLREGDVLGLAGPRRAIRAAIDMLTQTSSVPALASGVLN
jgi:K+/H+ antiporter YhaU regulatory subunit KhtT